MKGQGRGRRPGRALFSAEEAAGGRCGHGCYPVEVRPVEGGRSARCLGCGHTGPVRPSSAWALAALRDEDAEEWQVGMARERARERVEQLGKHLEEPPEHPTHG